MAGSSIIGALRVVLGADTASFETGLHSASASLSKFSTTSKIAAASIVAAMVGAFGALGLAIKKSIDEADSLTKMSQKIGIPIEELSKLKHAADLSGVGLDTLATGVGKLSRAMTDAAAKPTGEVAKAFETLRISVTNSNGDLKSSTQVLTEVAARFQTMEDGAQKTSLAMQLFGKSGRELIPLLNGGAAGLAEMFLEAEKLGIVFDQKTGKAAEQFNDDLSRLIRVKDGIIIKIVTGLVPALSTLTQKLVESAKSTDLWDRVAKGILSGLESLARIAIVVKDNIGLLTNALLVLVSIKATAMLITFGRTLLTIVTALKAATVATFLFTAAKTVLGSKIGAVGSIIAGSALALGIYSGKLDGLIGKIGELAGGLTTKFGEAFTSALKAAGVNLDGLSFKFDELASSADKPAPNIQKFNDAAKEGAKHAEELKDKLNSLNTEVLEASGAFAGQVAPGFLSTAEGMKALAGQVTNVRDRILILGPEAIKLNNAMLLLAGFRLSEEFMTPWQTYEQQLLRINAILQAHPQFADVAVQASAKAAASMAEAYGTAAQSIVGPMASAFKDLAGMNKKYAGAAKAFAIAEALINTYLGATKAFASAAQFGLPFAIAAAAAATTAGLINVAKISATEFAHGGSFRVGGSGGMDSQMVQFMATPGEMVDVRTPGTTGGPVGQPQSININVRGKVFGQETIAEIIDGINAAIRDNYKLNLKVA